MEDYIIKEAESQEEFEALERLTYKQYFNEGYIKFDPSERFTKFKKWDTLPESNVFIAIDKNGKIIGSMSTTTSNLDGFPLDKDFPKEVEEIKKGCFITKKHLGSAWRIVVDPDVKDKKLFLYLIKSGLEVICQKKVNIVLLVCNPRHIKFYNRMLGFHAIAEQSGVNCVDAPGVLMQADARHLILKWQQLCAKRNIPDTVDVRDVWWPTATANESWIEKIYYTVTGLFECLWGWPLYLTVISFFWLKDKFTGD